MQMGADVGMLIEREMEGDSVVKLVLTLVYTSDTELHLK